MLLSELFEQLSSGELAQVSLGDINDLAITPADYPKVIPSVNLGMTELYKRFPIRMEDVIIKQYAQISTYTLHKDFAETNTTSTQPIKYIHDSIYEPFKDNVLRIEKVFSELGVELPLNEEVDYGQNIDYWDSRTEVSLSRFIDHDGQSIKTPSYNSLQVLPTPIDDNNLLVQYRAAHEPIIITPDLIPGEVNLDIPLAMLEPLLLYVGGRVYANMHGSDPTAGTGYIQKFEASCQKIEDLNLFNKGTVHNIKLDRAGWI